MSPGRHVLCLLLCLTWIACSPTAPAPAEPPEPSAETETGTETETENDRLRGQGVDLLSRVDAGGDTAARVEALVDAADALGIALELEDRPLEAWARITRGQALRDLGATAAALEPLRRAQELARDLGNPAGAVDAASLRGLSLVELGQAEAAREVLSAARAEAVALDLDDRVAVLDRTLALGPRADRFPAEPPADLEAPLAEADALIGDLRARLALIELSTAAWDAGTEAELRAAIELARRQLDAARRQPHPEPIAMARRQLVTLYLVLGDLEEARVHLRELEPVAALLGPPWPSHVHQAWALILVHEGNLGDARRESEASLHGLRPGADDALRAAAHSGLGLVGLLEERVADAVDHYRRARDGFGPELAPGACARLDQPPAAGDLEVASLSVAESSLAMALSSAGRHAEALERARCAVDLGRRGLDVLGRSGPLEALARGHLLAGEAAAGADGRRHLRRAEELFRAVAEQHRYERRRLPPREQVRLVDFHSIADEAWQRTLVAQGEVERALAVAEASRVPELLTGRRPEAGLGAVEAARGLARRHGVTFVVYSLVHDPLQALLPARLDGRQQLEEKLYAWVVSPAGEVGFRQVEIRGLRGAGGLAHAVDTWHAGGGEVLTGLLVAPITDLLPPSAGGRPVPRLVIVPQGVLHELPFAALRDAAGRALVERYEVLVAPSVTSFGALASRPPSPRADVLVVGDPAAGSASRPRLDEARREAAGVAQRLGVTPLVGGRVTPAVLRRHLGSARHFHFAGHATHDRLLLAGDGEQDGALTVEDVLEVGPELDLAVLSACHAGAGEITAAGPVGLARALLAAGTRTVVANLWPADDGSAGAFMERFYSHLASGADAVTAHRAAVLDLPERDAEPWSWAGWRVAGAGGHP